MRRAVVAGSLALAAVSLPVAASGVAYASPSRCEISLLNNGYVFGPKAKNACSYASASSDPVYGGANRLACKGLLVAIGVSSSDAQDACFSY